MLRFLLHRLEQIRRSTVQPLVVVVESVAVVNGEEDDVDVAGVERDEWMWTETISTAYTIV